MDSDNISLNKNTYSRFWKNYYVHLVFWEQLIYSRVKLKSNSAYAHSVVGAEDILSYTDGRSNITPVTERYVLPPHLHIPVYPNVDSSPFLDFLCFA